MNKGKFYKIQEVATFIRPPLKHLLEIENSGGTACKLAERVRKVAFLWQDSHKDRFFLLILALGKPCSLL